MKTKKVIASIILVLFIAPSVLAQQEENQLYYTVKRTVKPEKIDNYLDLSRKFAAACKEHNFPHSYSVWQSNIYDFYWFYPVSSYNSVKDVSAAAWEIVHKLEERFAAKFYENIEYEEDFFIRYVDSLSYNPENKIEGLDYAEWRIHYTKPWTGMKYRKAFRQAVEMRKKINFEYPKGTLHSDIGMNGGSAYISVFWGKDWTDLYTNVAKAWEDLGDETQQLIIDLNPDRRKFETIPFLRQKDLSYTPE